MIAALAFDLDGVLVDAMAWHETAFRQAVELESGTIILAEEHKERFAGLPTKTKLAMLVADGEITKEEVDPIAQIKQRITRELIAENCHPDPTRLNLLRHLSAHFKLGCVTNCTRANAYDLLTRSELLPLMDIVITSDDVDEPKPSKRPYEQFCHNASLDPATVLAIEDHDKGMTAAFNAGCNAIQLVNYDDLTIEFIWEAIAKIDKEHKLAREGAE